METIDYNPFTKEEKLLCLNYLIEKISYEARRNLKGAGICFHFNLYTRHIEKVNGIIHYSLSDLMEVLFPELWDLKKERTAHTEYWFHNSHERLLALLNLKVKIETLNN